MSTEYATIQVNKQLSPDVNARKMENSIGVVRDHYACACAEHQISGMWAVFDMSQEKENHMLNINFPVGRYRQMLSFKMTELEAWDFAADLIHRRYGKTF